MTELATQSTALQVLERGIRTSSMTYVTKPLHAILVDADDRPISATGFDGILTEMNEEQAVLKLDAGDLESNRMVIGLEGPRGKLVFATLMVERQVAVDGSLRVEGRFAQGRMDVLDREKLIPRYNHGTQAFELGLDEDAIHSWVEIGVLRPKLLDRVLLCPSCTSLVTFRHGCPECGSGRTATSRMLHHFACAHVGPQEDFEGDQGLACPKCLTKNLVVGADYEFFDGVSNCLDCSWTGTELSFVGSCLACSLRMPVHLARIHELMAYDVDRLDTLALIDPS